MELLRLRIVIGTASKFFDVGSVGGCLVSTGKAEERSYKVNGEDENMYL